MAAVWVELGGLLAPVGRLTPADEPQFEVLCAAIADFRAARVNVDERGPLVAGQNGELVPNPALLVIKQASATIASVGAKFGLTPADRERAAKPAPSGVSRADQRLPPSQGGRPRRKAGAGLRVVAPEHDAQAG